MGSDSMLAEQARNGFCDSLDVGNDEVPLRFSATLCAGMGSLLPVDGVSEELPGAGIA